MDYQAILTHQFGIAVFGRQGRGGMRWRFVVVLAAEVRLETIYDAVGGCRSSRVSSTYS